MSDASLRPLLRTAGALSVIIAAGALMPMQPRAREQQSPPDSAEMANAGLSLVQLDPTETVAAESPELVQPGTSEAISDTGDVAPLHKIMPKWPRKALQDGNEGFVELEFTIEPNGTVADVEVLNAGPGELFVASATGAISKWTFKPFIIDGQPMARRATQRFEFLLKAGTASASIGQANADAADAAFESKRYAEAHKIYLDHLAPTGDKYALYMIGVMHVHGLGVPKDVALGAAWLELAVERGDKKLVAARDDAVAQLAEEERRRKDSLFEKLRSEFGDCAVVGKLLAEDRNSGATWNQINDREQFLRERCD